ncbi:hypothetical protein ACJRO7_001381 [Eucalyptus globulus]|uniref:Uncharacterized protein n=1 Tax=Eucalyptus globulus TaxID=34317 RepID=A0ABD3LRW1_EUCGL
MLLNKAGRTESVNPEYRFGQSSGRKTTQIGAREMKLGALFGTHGYGTNLVHAKEKELMTPRETTPFSVARGRVGLFKHPSDPHRKGGRFGGKGLVAEGAEKNPRRATDGWMEGRRGELEGRNVDGPGERKQIRRPSKRPIEGTGPGHGTRVQETGHNISKMSCSNGLL